MKDVKVSRRSRSLKRGAVLDDITMRDVLNVITLIDRIDAAIKSINTNIVQLKSSISTNKTDVRKVRLEMRDLAWEQRKDEVSIITKVERVLETYGVEI